MEAAIINRRRAPRCGNKKRDEGTAQTLFAATAAAASARGTERYRTQEGD